MQIYLILRQKLQLRNNRPLPDVIWIREFYSFLNQILSKVYGLQKPFDLGVALTVLGAFDDLV